MNYLKFRELFHEYAAKLEEQHTYYLDSVLGFSVLHERMMSKQLDVMKFLGEQELANEEFLDTCSTLYKELGGKDLTPMALSPVMKQGQVKSRNKENGSNTLILGANCVVSLFSYWEEYLRIQIGIAKGVLDADAVNNADTRNILNQHVTYDIWGDLRHLRNSIVHNNGIAYSKMTGCKIVRCFSPGDRVELDFEKMRAIFLLLADFRNELSSLSLPPRKGIRLPGKPL